MTEASQVATIESLAQNSRMIAANASHPPSSHHFGPKISIKLQGNNNLMWNQQFEREILTQRVHKVMVNLQFRKSLSHTKSY